MDGAEFAWSGLNAPKDRVPPKGSRVERGLAFQPNSPQREKASP